MSIKSRVLEVVVKWSSVRPNTADAIAQEVATAYGRSNAKTDGKLSGSVKNGQGIIKDGAGVMLPATPSVRLFLACCKLRDEVEKLASRKGAYGFDCHTAPKLACPGLDAAFADHVAPTERETLITANAEETTADNS